MRNQPSQGERHSLPPDDDFGHAGPFSVFDENGKVHRRRNGVLVKQPVEGQYEFMPGNDHGIEFLTRPPDGCLGRSRSF